MKDKLTIRMLGDNIARNLYDTIPNCSGEQAQQFVKDLFDVVSQALQNGESVAIDNLGVFMVTGNRDIPVSFVADSTFAERVNEPFSMFESQAIPDTVTDSMLDSVQEPETATFMEPSVVYEPAEIPVLDDGILTAVADEPAPAEPVEMPEPVGDMIERFESVAPEPVVIPEPVVRVVVEPAPVQRKIPVDPWVPSDDEEEESESNQTEIPVRTETVSVQQPKPEPAHVRVAEPESEKRHPEIDLVKSSATQDMDSTEGSRFGFGFLCGLLTGLAIGAVCVLLYVMFAPVPGMNHADKNLPQPGDTALEMMLPDE